MDCLLHLCAQRPLGQSTWPQPVKNAMKFLDDFKMYGRFARGLSASLTNPISLEEARADVARQVAERETNFLRLLKRGIFE